MIPEEKIKTTCPYCGVGCGIIAARGTDGKVEIAGDPDHPANFGRLCSKGSALAETLSLTDRELHPLIGSEHASWNEALDLVARKFSGAIRDFGPDSVAFYVSGQLLTEDYYVANKLMKGFIGSANIDTNSRLCMASAVAGHIRAFGSDTVPGAYEDFELADLVVLVGSNLAWCHPVLFQRLMAARETRGTKLIVIDPRRTVTAEAADIHLALRPGSDVALFNGLLKYLFVTGKADADFVARHTSGLESALAACGSAELAGTTGLAAAEIESFFALFAAMERSITAFSQGVNQSTSGTDKVNAIINCHLLTGRIGKPGMGPFSLTGQPNAMGGREVGGLANTLAAHMDIDNPDHRARVQAFWSSPRIAATPGRKAVDLFRAVRDGSIKALWIMATNPAVSMPDADAVAGALKTCPFTVISDVTAKTDTARHAHVFLPAAAWGEKNGTVTNSERRISRQRPFLPLPGEARPDWRIIGEVAKRMGFTGFDFSSPAEIFREHAALTGLANKGTRDLDLTAQSVMSDVRYEELAPFQWGKGERYFGNGRFYTADGRARFVPTPWRNPAQMTTAALPFILNTGRIRDQWHTMTRTAKTPRLMQHIAEPFAELHPDDARMLDVGPASLVEIVKGEKRVVLRALLNPRQQRGCVFVPMHWSATFSGNAVANRLVAANTDPVSGQPELKYSAVSVRPVQATWYGFAVSRARPDCSHLDYWSLAPAENGYRLECAGTHEAESFDQLLERIFPVRGDLLAYRDQASGEHRFAAFEGDRLEAAIFFARRPVGVSRNWLAAQLAQGSQEANRLRVLAGRGGQDGPDHGAIVCSCFSVGIRQIMALIAGGGASTVKDVGALLKAGTNCGSCKPEIGRIIHETHAASAVAASPAPHRAALGAAGLPRS